MGKPLVSIIMGVYNGEDTIEKCVNSIFSQTYDNWEFIICDDCSTDDTYYILKKIQRRDNRILLLHNKKNKRLAATLNYCLQYAKGKYIARMDADDESMPERLEKQVGFLEAHPEYAVVGTARYITAEGKIMGIRRGYVVPDRSTLLKDVPYGHPTIMMREEVYRALGGYRESKDTMRSEDLDLWFRFYAYKYQGYNIQEPLYKYTESICDYKKRTLIAGIYTAKIFLRGYKMLDFPFYQYIFAIKPIISAILPSVFMYRYHVRKLDSVDTTHNEEV